MFKLKSTFAIIVILFIETSCAWLDKSSHEKIIGDYEIGWNDLVRNRSITKLSESCSGCSDVIVGGYVYAVGHNQNYIIAKQHLSAHDTTTYYYIIDISNKEKFHKVLDGSSDKTIFDSIRNGLRISNITFDKQYPENP